MSSAPQRPTATTEDGPPDTSSFDVRMESSTRRHIIRLFGEIDANARSAVEQCLDQAIKAGGQIVIDLSGTSFMDSTGLNVLVQAHHRTGRLQEAIILRSPSPVVERLLRVTGIGDLITVQRSPQNRKRPLHQRDAAEKPSRRTA